MRHTGETTLIDAGTPDAGGDLRGEIEVAGSGTEDTNRVLVTRLDLDHVGTLAHVEFDCPTYAVRVLRA